MQIMIAFILLFSLLTNSLAAEVTIYNFLNYFNAAPGSAIPRAVSHTPWRFGFKSKDYTLIYVKAITKSPGMKWTVRFHTNEGSVTAKNHISKTVGQYHFVSGYFKSTDLAIRLDVFRNGVLCSSQLLAEGRTHWQGNKDPLSRDVCGGVCVLEVDITNECVDPGPVTSNTTTVTPVVHIKEKTNNNSATTNDAHASSPNVMLMYVIPSVIGICVIIVLVMYIIAKKYRRRNSEQVDEIELNTYATSNEVLYADLGLAHGGSQLPRREEDSTYAQIVGVIRPIDDNVKKK